MKQLKPRDKITQKMTRDGAVEINETQQTAERISSREADSDFSQPDSAAAERVMEHLDAAHTRKVNKKAVKKAQEATVLRTSTSRLQFTDEERATPELQPYIKKSEKAADRLDAAKAAIPKQKKLVKERTFEEATGKAKTRLHFEEQEKPIPGRQRQNRQRLRQTSISSITKPCRKTRSLQAIPFSRFMQKQKIKRQYAKTVKKSGAATAKAAAGASQTAAKKSGCLCRATPGRRDNRYRRAAFIYHGIRRAFFLRGNVFRQHEQRVRDFLHVGGQRPCGDGTELCRNGT